ncbi:tetraspanin-33 [Octopus bimaculoides]|uniref:tetraspanin-33 n=1 Tax=Octopus bimaculoides TaxID=37653 RepID=UPI0022E27D47|nr:tetraspanin-33 [Octopus bimaculoides]
MARRNEDDSYVNPLLKYTVFLSNFIVWLVGAGMIGIGTWAYIEKNSFNQTQIETIYDAFFDISLIFIVIGIIIFILGFTGYIGALRENICLLKCFNILLGGIFLILLGGAVAAFLLKDKFTDELTSIFQENLIPRYTEDDDTKNLVNWIQEQLKCCGIGKEGYKDWNQNEYFNCTGHEKRMAHAIVECSVPYSCCKYPDEVIASKTIYTTGCIPAAILFIENYLPVVGGILIAFNLSILATLFLVSCLQSQISRQRARW